MAQHILLICFLITLMVIIPKSSSTPPFYISSICSNTTVFAPKSRYQTNLNTVFRYLSANAAYAGYDAESAGDGTSDMVYGQFLCRGDQSPSSCQDCVSTAINTDLPKTYCPNSKVAIIWYDECMVRYSNVSFFGVLDQSGPHMELLNTQNITGNVSHFMDVMNDMMTDMVSSAVNGGTYKKYAINFATYSDSGISGIYGLEQCTPDLRPADCDQCLVNAIQRLPISKGGRTIWTSCNVRFEVYPFFIGASNLVSSPIASPPLLSSNSTGKVHLPSITPIVGTPHPAKLRNKLLISISILVSISCLGTIIMIWIRMKKKKAVKTSLLGETHDITTVESLQFEWNTIKTATRNFCMDNKLGEGGFGEVYKGVLENGQEIAVKRLSKNSGQGTAEFNTEIVVVAKLQHKNLVKLLGFCLAPKEKILVYEYLPNSSLDRCISDNDKRLSMAWETRFKIINGIARGLLYLHEDSRLKIVHRDLKPSNILLDAGMNPKIADFGLAKLFEVDQTQGDTNKIVGTYGYLAPEYAMTGHFSVKSDVYSFGVIILEILSGQRNRFFNRPQLEEALLHRAWRHWNEGSPLNLVDTLLGDSYPREEVTKCIHIAILCIQDNAIERPRMASVVAALSGQSISLPMPKAPTFFGDLKTTVAELHYNQLDENIQDIVYRQTKTIRKNSPSSYSGTEGITELYPR